MEGRIKKTDHRFEERRNERKNYRRKEIYD